MGLFEFYSDEKNREGTWLEGKESRPHDHKDGSYGTDIEAYRNTYKKDVGKVASEKAKDWGKEHTIKDRPSESTDK